MTQAKKPRSLCIALQKRFRKNTTARQLKKCEGSCTDFRRIEVADDDPHVCQHAVSGAPEAYGAVGNGVRVEEALCHLRVQCRYCVADQALSVANRATRVGLSSSPSCGSSRGGGEVKKRCAACGYVSAARLNGKTIRNTSTAH